MGAESFDVLLESPLSVGGFAAILAVESLVENLVLSHPGGARFYVYEDEFHLIEFELSERPDGGSNLAARFALCQRETVDEEFVSRVLRLARFAQADLSILADLPEGYKGTFGGASLDGAESAIRNAAAYKRRAWVRDFRVTNTRMSCDEVLHRVLLGTAQK